MARAAATFVILWLAVGCAGGRPAPRATTGGPAEPVRLTLLAINDFHGALAPRTVAGRPAGGAAVLAGWLAERVRAARTAGGQAVIVHAGDMIGGSPLESALLQDEPTVEALDAMGVGFGAVGNHEFDEGLDELLRLQKGGCHPATEPRTGCFRGARMQWLAANVVREGGEEPVLPPYAVLEAGGVRVGFIGVVLEATPEIQLRAAVAGLRFLDEADTVNRYAADLAGRGVRALVVLIHQGGTGKPDGGEPIRGPIVEVVERFAPEVDLVMSGHTHEGYVGLVPRKTGGPPLLVAQAYAHGTAFAEFDVRIDRRTGDVVAADARLVRTYHHADPGDPASIVPPDPAVAAIVARAEAAAAPLARRVVGRAAGPITRARSPAGESALGNLVADAHRAATGADLAVTNPGGLREDLPAGDVTYASLFAAQPFGNTLVTVTLTGDELRRLLEQQWQQAEGREVVRPLQVSGFTYVWDPGRPAGRRVVEVRLADGRPLDPAARYTLAANSFLADGGDGFTVLREARERRGGPGDLDALAAHVGRLPQPFSARVEGRIAIAGPSAPR